jgi:hypothetical protein
MLRHAPPRGVHDTGSHGPGPERDWRTLARKRDRERALDRRLGVNLGGCPGHRDRSGRLAHIQAQAKQAFPIRIA